MFHVKHLFSLRHLKLFYFKLFFKFSILVLSYTLFFFTVRYVFNFQPINIPMFHLYFTINSSILNLNFSCFISTYFMQFFFLFHVKHCVVLTDWFVHCFVFYL